MSLHAAREDKYGHVNVVVWGRDCERWRHSVVTAIFLMFDGVIEREGTSYT
jgi:hypothetical protein